MANQEIFTMSQLKTWAELLTIIQNYHLHTQICV